MFALQLQSETGVKKRLMEVGAQLRLPPVLLNAAAAMDVYEGPQYIEGEEKAHTVPCDPALWGQKHVRHIDVSMIRSRPTSHVAERRSRNHTKGQAKGKSQRKAPERKPSTQDEKERCF